MTAVDQNREQKKQIEELRKAQETLQDRERSFIELLTYSEVSYFIYYPKLHRYEAPLMPEAINQVPVVMDNYPEAFMDYTELSPAHRMLYAEMINRIDKGEKEAECTVRFKYNGNFLWFKVHLRNRLDDEGKPIKAYGYAVNVDRLMEAENALSAERLRMASTTGSDVLAVSCFSVSKDSNIKVNNDTNIVYQVNSLEDKKLRKEAAEVDPRILQQNHETLLILFSAAREIPDEGQRKRFIKICSNIGMVEAYARGEREVIQEYRRKIGDSILWVRTRTALLPDPKTGDILAFYYTTNINEQKIKQEILNNLIDEYFDFATYLDLKTNIVRLIKSTPDVVAIPPAIGDYDNINNENIPKYIYPEDQKKCYQEFALAYIKEQLTKTKTLSIYYRTINPARPGENCHHMLMRASYLNDEKRYIVFCRSDITEQVEEEEERNRKLEEAVKKAKKANAAKTNFLARMSHDIRTPLNGILGMTQLAMDEELSPQVRDYVEKIDQSGHFLLSLVNDILDMNKVESGKMELHPEHYSYKELEHYIEAVIKPLCTSKNIQFHVSNPFVEYTVLVDKVRLNQIIFNLLSNAVKFTPRGGQVWLEFKHHQVQRDNLTLDMVVRDSGIGMSEEFQRKMFQPFEQEFTEYNSKRTGSGLGLSIVKSLVDLMGGTIKVQSTKGVGTEITIQLSFKITPKVETTTVKEQAIISLQDKCILVVEDNAINAEIVLRLLQKKGAIGVVATDGSNAVKQYADAEQYYFDAILMDVQMPVMDGLEATRRIRALNRPDAKTVPIIAMTANAYNEDIQTCLQAGMDAHLAKPLDVSAMYKILGQYIK